MSEKKFFLIAVVVSAVLITGSFLWAISITAARGIVGSVGGEMFIPCFATGICCKTFFLIYNCFFSTFETVEEIEALEEEEEYTEEK